mgnify:CR=1 FL=1
MYQRLKRGMDFMLALLGLIVLCPLFLTTAMSPFKILKIWGSSSRLVLRRNFPTSVFKGEGVVEGGTGSMRSSGSDREK